MNNDEGPTTNAQSDVDGNPSTPPQDGESSSQPSGLEGTGFKWGDDASVPEYLRGKTPAETLDIMNTLVQGVQELSMQPRQQEPAYYGAPTPATPVGEQDMSANDGGMPDPNLAITDPHGYQEQLMRAIRMQQQADLVSAAAPVFQQTADQARLLSTMDTKWSPMWDKYGSEIDGEVQHIAPQQRTKQLYDRAAELIYARHSDEIIEDRAKVRAQEMLESGVGTASPTQHGLDMPHTDSDQWSKFERSELGRRLIDRVGKRKVLEFCEDENMTLESYADMVAGNRASFDPDNPGSWQNEDLAPFVEGENDV